MPTLDEVVTPALTFADDSAPDDPAAGNQLVYFDGGVLYYKGSDGVPHEVGGGGAGVSTSAYASPPASPSEGDLWLPSDSVYVLRYSGTAWVPWGTVYPFVAPVSDDFAWINQETATIDTTYGGIYLAAAADAGLDVRIRKKAAPSVPYTVTAAILNPCMDVNYNTVGLCWRQSSDGKLIIAGCKRDNRQRLVVEKWTNPNNYSAAYSTFDYGWAASAPIWLRIADNNTNRIFSVSADGRHWHALHTVSRTDFLTADEVGFCVLSANGTYAASMMLLSWQEG